MAEKVLNVKTGKLENCTVGIGCRIHSHSNMNASSANIETISAEIENGEKTVFHIVNRIDENSEHEGARKLELYVNEGDDFSPAYLEYHYDPVGVVYIDYLKSNIEGKGHARTLLDYIYEKYPRSNIDWGEILHPAASYLYEKYSQKYGRSYSWEDDEDSGW